MTDTNISVADSVPAVSDDVNQLAILITNILRNKEPHIYTSIIVITQDYLYEEEGTSRVEGNFSGSGQNLISLFKEGKLSLPIKSWGTFQNRLGSKGINGENSLIGFYEEE